MPTPLCPIYKSCGGCQYQHLSYQEELHEKYSQLKETLHDILMDHTDLDAVIPSPKEYHYRHRLDLRLLRRKYEGILIGFTPKTGRGVIPIEHCPIAHEAINTHISVIKKEAIAKLPDKYRMANLVIRTGEARQVFWGGIGRRSLQMHENNYFWTTINSRKIYYALDTFFQANLFILPNLMTHLQSLPIWHPDTIFFDLYGGVGLFGISLYDHVTKVELIEDCPASVKLAQYNIDQHQLSHFNITTGRTEDHLPNLLTQYAKQPKIAMIDPPRAGLSDTARNLLVPATNIDHLLYLSCHPESLARDLKVFIDHHWHIQRITPFDFFPRTRHIETLVWLTPKK